MSDEVNSIINEIYNNKVRPYKELYELSKNSNRANTVYAIQKLMAYKDDLTDEMKKVIKDTPLNKRDYRKDVNSYNRKWIIGEYKESDTFYIYPQDQQNQQDKQDQQEDLIYKEPIEIRLLEIYRLTEIKEIQSNIQEIDLKNQRNITNLGNSFINMVMNGIALAYKLTTANSLLGYLILLGRPMQADKSGVAMMTVIDTQKCLALNISPKEFSQKSMCNIYNTLMELNNNLGYKFKEVY